MSRAVNGTYDQFQDANPQRTYSFRHYIPQTVTLPGQENIHSKLPADLINAKFVKNCKITTYLLLRSFETNSIQPGYNVMMPF